MGRKPVVVAKYDKQGNLIEIYPSTTQAAKENYVSLSNITAVVHGRRKSCGGFIWKEVSDECSVEEN